MIIALKNFLVTSELNWLFFIDSITRDKRKSIRWHYQIKNTCLKRYRLVFFHSVVIPPLNQYKCSFSHLT
jgi:hypothetical protein